MLSRRSAEHGFTPSWRSTEHGFTLSLRSAEHGFTLSLRSAEHGFTLVEMLVALAIFALVSAAGVMLLRSSIDTQAAVTARLNDTTALVRTRALIAADLMAAQPRPVRGADGGALPALAGDAAALTLVAAFAGAEGGLARTSYRVDGKSLVRLTAPYADAEPAGPPAVLLRDITAVQWRYRAADGQWADRWAPDRPDRLPVAVELSVTRGGAAPVVIVLPVAPDGIIAPAAPAPDGGA